VSALTWTASNETGVIAPLRLDARTNRWHVRLVRNVCHVPRGLCVSPVPFTQVIRGTDGRYSCDDARAGRLLGVPYRWVMPWFDLFMMRKQFLNLRRLAEKTAVAAA